jgi:predicted amino acid-binding ACT domain protein
MGITEISSVDFEYAKLLGCTIKLIGTAERLSDFGEHDGDLSVYVAPKLIPTTHLLATTRGVENTIAIKSANLGMTSYSGAGGGRFPTAHSIVADICRVASNTASLDPFPVPLTRNNGIDNDYSSAFYIRITFHDELGIIRRVGELAEINGVSICSILQNPIKNRMSADFVVTTEECKFSQVEQMCQDIGRENFAHNIPIFMPMSSEYGRL